MNTNLAKMLVIASVSVVGLTVGEGSLAKTSDLMAQNNDIKELQQLDQQRKEQQEDLNKKIELLDKINKSPTEKPSKSPTLADIAEETPSNWLLTLAIMGGSGVAGIAGLWLFRTVLIHLLVNKEEQAKLLKLAAHEQPWWNRPLLGPNSIFDFVFTGNKAYVPDEAITLYKTYLGELNSIGAIAKSQDLEKFNSQDFLSFLKIKSYFGKNEGDYEGLKESTDLLDVAIKSKNSFLAIDQTELRYQGRKQQEFYQNVANLLGQELDKENFIIKVQEQLELVLLEIKSEEGKQALQNYQEELKILSEAELGLKLLSLFKAYNLSDFNILIRVSEILDPLEKSVLTDTKELIIPIMKDYQIFEKLAPIIGLPKNKVNPKIFAMILQYIALQDRHRDSYREYANLNRTLKDWKNAYDSLILVREQYNPEEYKIPAEFKEQLVGEEIYNKYKFYLD